MNFFERRKLSFLFKRKKKRLEKRKEELISIYINYALRVTTVSGQFDIFIFELSPAFISEEDKMEIIGYNDNDVWSNSQIEEDSDTKVGEDLVKMLEHKFRTFTLTVISRMKHLGYIEEIVENKSYKLLPSGIEAKRWTSHNKFEKYNKNKLRGEIIENWLKRHYVSVLISGLALLISIISVWITITKMSDINDFEKRLKALELRKSQQQEPKLLKTIQLDTQTNKKLTSPVRDDQKE